MTGVVKRGFSANFQRYCDGLLDACACAGMTKDAAYARFVIGISG